MKEVIVLAAFLILWGVSTYTILKATVKQHFSSLELEIVKARGDVVESRLQIEKQRREIMELKKLVLILLEEKTNKELELSRNDSHKIRRKGTK